LLASGLKLLRTVRVGFGEPPHLIRSQAKVAQYCPEWLAVIDGREELLPYLDR
jgi:hypothetical protein